MQYINSAVINDQKLAEYKTLWNAAEPYPHVIIENFLEEDVANQLYEHFPKIEELRKHYKNLNESKSEGSSFDQYHESFEKVRLELGSPEFLQWVEKLTGLENLILPDDHRGSGLHQGPNGSYLDVHVDFSVHPILNIHRRLNVLLFLNKHWKEEYGGHLELWDEKVKKCYHKILPSFNRCVISVTDSKSFHGYSKINVPEGETRKSMFTYLYTPMEEGVKYHDTIFKARPSESTAKKVSTFIKENSKNGIKKVLKTLGMKKIFEKYE